MEINLALLLIGLCFVIGGIIILVKQLKSKQNCNQPATAEVIDYHTEIRQSANDDGDSIVYYPVMKYYALGQWHENRHDLGRGRKKYALGERIEILYDPNNPDSFIIAGDKTTSILALIAIVIGIGVILLSVFAK